MESFLFFIVFVVAFPLFFDFVIIRYHQKKHGSCCATCKDRCYFNCLYCKD